MVTPKVHPSTVRGLKAEWRKLINQLEKVRAEIGFLHEDTQAFMSKANNAQYDSMIATADKIESVNDTLDDVLIEARRT